MNCLPFKKIFSKRGDPKRPPRRVARPPISMHPMSEQAQSPLFSSHFPAELRIIIFEAVLGDPHRLMHICPFSDGSERVGRRRCEEDPEFAFPTWQHKCFGIWEENRDGFSVIVTHRQFFCQDHLLSLLLCCRRVYSEALSTLYTANHFSFQGARGLLAMKSAVPTLQWHSISHINVSTFFLTPTKHFATSEGFPPEGISRWVEGCRALRDMRNLRSLHLDLIIWHITYQEVLSAVDSDSLITILEPLQQLSLPDFVVELNLPFPELVGAALGDLKFTLVIKQRPFNRDAYPV